MSGGGVESYGRSVQNVGGNANGQHKRERCGGGGAGCGCFRMPLHYPRFSRADYETMPEWKLDSLLAQYGLPVTGDVNQKRQFAMGAFLWPQ